MNKFIKNNKFTVTMKKKLLVLTLITFQISFKKFEFSNFFLVHYRIFVTFIVVVIEKRIDFHNYPPNRRILKIDIALVLSYYTL